MTDPSAFTSWHKTEAGMAAERAARDWWDQQEGEIASDWVIRTTRARNYQTYKAVIDAVTERYEVSIEAATEEVASWIYDQGQEAADEKEAELIKDAEVTAEEMGATLGWPEKEEEDEDDDD
jgi:hypothetical protein